MPVQKLKRVGNLWVNREKCANCEIDQANRTKSLSDQPFRFLKLPMHMSDDPRGGGHQFPIVLIHARGLL